jgi:hypothetical protein
VQTFVPVADFAESATYLDYRRLGKQRVETLQILNSLTFNRSHGWRNHPAVKMWEGHEAGLAAYGVAICLNWLSRGYRDTCLEKISAIIQPDPTDLPPWWGDERVHSSHRSNLLRKDPAHYGQFGWSDDPSAEYFWPSSSYEMSALIGSTHGYVYVTNNTSK